MKEIFKSVCGYDGFYSVSNTGFVKSDRTGKILNFDSSHKYARVSLSVDGVVKRFFVHRLVGDAFIPNIENKPCINHIDSNVRNNDVSNLEWCTHSENAIHSNAFGDGALAQKNATIAAAKKASIKRLSELKDILGDRFISVNQVKVSYGSRFTVKFRCTCGNVYQKRIDSVVVKRGGICSQCKG